MTATIERLDPGTRLSRAVIHGDTVYTAGLVADDTAADAAGQAQQILAKLGETLARAGSGRSKLLSVTIWLADIGDYDDVNRVWDAWIVPGNPPARACVQAPLAGPQYRVEIAAIAAR